MVGELNDLTGSRGELIFELQLTDYQYTPEPLFRPGFLGAKWRAIDYYVELTSEQNLDLYFFVQVKTTRASLTSRSTHLRIGTTKHDIKRLLQIPAPTYVIGVHEPTHRVFVRSIHLGIPIQAIRRIPLAHELTGTNLQRLHDEVRDHWRRFDHKPSASVFS